MADEISAVTEKSIVILGGSYGGVSTAHYVLRHAIPPLPDKESYKVIIVSSSAQAMCRPACPRALISDEMFNQSKLFVSIPEQFKPYPKEWKYPEDAFRFIQGTAVKLDHTQRKVSIELVNGKTEMLDFYSLVIATGASTPSPLLGLNSDVPSLRANWTAFRRALTSAKTVVIAGGGPAGIETAGELGEYLNGKPGWFGTKPTPKVAITVVTSGSAILPALRPALAAKAEAYLAGLGVTVIKNTRVKTVSPPGAGTEDVAAKATLTLEDGKLLEADLYVPATGTTPNTAFVDKSLLAPDGRVENNTSTLRFDKAGPRIYAVGDVASYARPAIHLILEAIPVLCANIKRDLFLEVGMSRITGQQDRVYKEDMRETQMVPIGTGKGVGAAMGWSLPSWMVWAIKGRDYWLWTTGGLWDGSTWHKEF